MTNRRRSATTRSVPPQTTSAGGRRLDVADAAAMLRVEPIALLHVATVLLDSANRGLLELKRRVQAGEPRSVIGRTVEKIEGLLGATGANLMYAGYPYDSFAPDAPKS